MPWVIPIPVRGDDEDNYIGDNGLAHERMHGYGGNDTLAGSTLYDTAFGGDGNDTLDGGAGNDNILATSGLDFVYGGAGNDELWGQFGRVLFYGGTGRDLIAGETGNDTVFGGAGRDLIEGGDGSNWLVGGHDDDTVIGENGSDTIVGGAGLDDMTGYGGADRFRFGSATEIGNDWGAGANSLARITDFISGEDVVDLRQMQVDFVWIGGAAFDRSGPQLRFDAGSHWLQGDVNGDGSADFTLLPLGVSTIAESDLLT